MVEVYFGTTLCHSEWFGPEPVDQIVAHSPGDRDQEISRYGGTNHLRINRFGCNNTAKDHADAEKVKRNERRVCNSLASCKRAALERSRVPQRLPADALRSLSARGSNPLSQLHRLPSVVKKPSTRPSTLYVVRYIRTVGFLAVHPIEIKDLL